MSKVRVAFFFGGVSPEHEVSVVTAVQAMAAAPDNIEVVPVYASKSGQLYTGAKLLKIESYQLLEDIPKLATEVSLPSSPQTQPALTAVSSKLWRNVQFPFDVIFPCFHGGVGEGGWIQNLAQYLDLPLASSGPTGAAIGMDKVLMKQAFAAAGIKQAPFSWFTRQDWETNRLKLIKNLTDSHPYPVFVKPSRGGSSIGTTKASSKEELVRAIDLAATLDTRIIVETGLTKTRELNVSVIGYPEIETKASVVEEVVHDATSEFLDFSQKYLGKSGKSQGMASTSRVVPAKITKTLSNKLQETSQNIFRLFDCGGVVRIDYLVKDRSIYCVEVNTIPGSLSFYLWDKSGYPYPKLINYLVKQAIASHQKTRVVKTFSSNILRHYQAGSAGKLTK